MSVLSHESAAAVWGIDVRARHALHVTVPRNCAHRVPGTATHRADLADTDVRCLAGVAVTSPLRTVVDCARTLPFGWGLAAADSALRLGLVTRAALRSRAAVSRGPGSPHLRRVAEAADERAGSCLESLTRALCIERGIGPLALQSRIFRDGHPYDLEIVGARTLIEADGAAYHRDADRFQQDCEDITVAAREGYVIIRVTWYDSTRRPAWTGDAIERAAARNLARLSRERAAAARRRTRRDTEAASATDR